MFVNMWKKRLIRFFEPQSSSPLERYYEEQNRPYNPGNYMEPTVTGRNRWGEVYPGLPGNPGGAKQKKGRGGLGFKPDPSTSVSKKGKKGDAFSHLEKFSSLQMVALFVPELKITVDQVPTAGGKSHFRASCTYQGISAILPGL